MPHTNETLALLALSLVPNITPADLYALYKAIPSASALLTELSKPSPLITDEYGRPASVSTIERIQADLPTSVATAIRILHSLPDKSITPIPIHSPLFPPFLRLSSASPILLYHRGTPLPHRGRYITLLASSQSSSLFFARSTRVINEIAKKMPDAIVVTSATSHTNWHILRKCQSLAIPCIALSPSHPVPATNATVIGERPTQRKRNPKTVFARHQLLLATISPVIIIIDCSPNSRLPSIAQKAIDHNRYVFAIADPNNPYDGANRLIESNLASPYISIEEIKELTIYGAEV